ncbi:MAG: ankyrin repeat domain-containing protein [Pseudolysinimonas sp.]
MTDDTGLLRVMAAIAGSDVETAREFLIADARLATAGLREGASRATRTTYFLDDIRHHLYAGDTALHVAAAAHNEEVVRLLLAGGADAAGRNRRGATPLHYAADADPGSERWSPSRQSEVIDLLLRAGGDPNAADHSGVTPLHRAARAPSAAAVAALLKGGADASHRTPRGSTPIMVATKPSGRSGSGSPAARQQRTAIILLLENAR